MKIVTIILVLTVGCFLGFGIGWWLYSANHDFLCSSSSVYRTTEPLESDLGIKIPSGIEVTLRSCEYADRFSIELYTDNKIEKELFIPLENSSNKEIRQVKQYSVGVVE